ncbi:CPBP family intramembrane glutamic endopeptidase [Pikeienuella sp. HZG-20]|uniref:CPBP family intramembrane glutamic endopeptidase n=1 Tax=Paludibacillus litoralis TaxID=3133267 RepID=UPI0030EEC466
MPASAPIDTAPPRARLWAEFICLFVGAPLAAAAAFGRFPLFPALIGFTLIGCGLLAVTPGWRWRALLRGPVFGEWRLILGFALVTAAAALALTLALRPDRLFALPLSRPDLWLMILLLYPILSALPQELVFRALFFERYGALFPNRAAAVAMNGAVFALAHLFFANWVAIAMTGFGGAIMGWAYIRRGAFGLALVLHTLAGWIIFTAGLGVYFYHGAIGAAP